MTPFVRQWWKPGALVLACVAVFFACFEHYETEVSVAPTDGANDRHAALSRLLTELGVKVRKVAALQHMPREPQKTVVFWLAAVNKHSEPPADVADWVRDGGHLVWDSNASGAQSTHVGSDSSDDEPFLNDLERAQLGPAGWLAKEVSSLDAAAGGAVVTSKIGRGRLSYVPYGVPFYDATLLDADNAKLLWRAITLHGVPEEVLLVVWQRSDSLWATLLRHAFAAMFALFVFVAVWMWSRMHSLGPIRAVAPAHRRSALEHIAAAGRFHWRTDDAVALLAANRAVLRATLDVRWPETAAMSEPRWTAAVAAAAEVTQLTVQRAMLLPCPDRKRFLAAIVAQQTLEDR